MSWRDVKNEARATLHETMEIAAHYFTSLPVESEDPVEITVRVHSSFKALGDQPGTSYQFAERHEGITSLIFLGEQIDPDNGGVVSISATEAYLIDNVLPPDGITIKAEVTRITGSDLAGIPSYPEEE